MINGHGAGRVPVAAELQSVYRKAIVPELQRGDEVMDQLFSWRHLPQRAEEARLKREAAPERRAGTFRSTARVWRHPSEGPSTLDPGRRRPTSCVRDVTWSLRNTLRR